MKRKYLRKKIQEVLKSARIPGVGDSVFCSRTIPTSEDELPLILIYNKEVGCEVFQESPKRYRKELEMVIEAISQHDNGENLSCELDDISILIENAIERNTDIEDDLESIDCKGTNFDLDGSGSAAMGSAITRYTFGWIEDAREEKVLPDLETVSTKYKMNGNENDNTEDLITYP